MSNFYADIRTVTNPDDMLVLVNKNFALPTGYEPTDLVLLDVALYTDAPYAEYNYLRQEAADATKALFDAAYEEEGYVLLARSAYRSIDSQQDIYLDYYADGGQQLADTYSARPYHSEHQTGLALDVSAESVRSGQYSVFGASVESEWVAENAHRFGFIVRYPEGKESLTGYGFEPWHIRYVGIEAATEIYEADILLEDYLLEHALIKTLPHS